MKFSRLSRPFLLAFIGGLVIAAASFAEKSPAPGNTVIKTVTPANSEMSEITPTGAETGLPVPKKATARLWNLQDADILSVINEVSQETGKNFVVDPRVTGKITLISSKPLRQNEVYQVFLSVLGVLGYSAIPNGNVIKIVPNMESGEQVTSIATNRSPGKGEEVVVRVIPLENISATQLIPVIRPMLPQWSNISAYTPGNVLILLGRASNLFRIMNVIQDVDKAANSGIQIIPLHHASAAQVATVLNNLQSAARSAGESTAISIAVDERSNSVLLGGPKAMRLRMRVLIARLDSPSTTPSGNTEVIYLRYLEAKTFAPLLNKIALNIQGKDGGASYDASTSVTTSSNASTAATTTTKDVVTNQSNIQAEPNSNAVIITASPALMTAIKSVISKLDIRPAQVLVESIIVQVNESNLSNLGIQWGSVTPNGNVQIAASGTPTSFPSFGAGTVGIIPHVRIAAILNALQNLNGVNILSTPQIVVLDNQKATIEIGQMVPTQTGSYVTPVGSGSGSPLPFTTNDYKNVTLKLDVVPQINLGTSIRLKLNLKNDTLQNPQNPGLTPLINTSKITNMVIVNSDDVLVLGGLISDTNNENTNKVPILGDIPVIGQLFKQKTMSRSKQNLLVFIKPVIMQNSEDAMTISHMKYSMAQRVEANYRDDLAEISSSPLSVLPPWKNEKELPRPFENNDP
jgi:general secretion pathway protein D